MSINGLMNKEDVRYIYMCVCVCVCMHIYIYIVEYYLVIKRNKIIAFVATWMDLEIAIVSQVRKRKTNTI